MFRKNGRQLLRYAFFGDIHGNLEALNAVLNAMSILSVDEYICLGDIVGYGANPQECVNMIRELKPLAVVGNHDHAATGHIDVRYFNQYARLAALWTREQLDESSRNWLASLPFVEHAENFSIAHGSLQSPEVFNYVQTLKHAEYNFEAMDKPLLVLGHSHQTVMFFDTNPITFGFESKELIDPLSKTIVNCGSVGQPRDEDPRASFMIYDDSKQEVCIHRIEYDFISAQAKIRSAGLPESLALRLPLGK